MLIGHTYVIALAYVLVQVYSLPLATTHKYDSVYLSVESTTKKGKKKKSDSQQPAKKKQGQYINNCSTVV